MVQQRTLLLQTEWSLFLRFLSNWHDARCAKPVTFKVNSVAFVQLFRTIKILQQSDE